MNHDQTIKLFDKGRNDWNKWALQMLISKDINSEEWKEAAIADFGELTAGQKNYDFEGFIFPGDVNLESAYFNGIVNFNCAVFHGDAFFAGAKFVEDAFFNNCVFLSNAWFSHYKLKKKYDSTKYFSIFAKRAYFNNTIFNSESWFSHVIFEDDVQFLDASFSAWARFDDLICKGNIQFSRSSYEKRLGPSPNGAPHEGGVWFVGGSFSGQAWFKDTIFYDDVSFQGVVFNHDAIFQSTQFWQKAIFKGMSSNRMFALSNSIFNEIPDFIQTHFTESPIFDDVKILNNNRQKKQINSDSNSHDISAKWRALRRLAVQGHDYDKEREFFAGEIWSAPRNSFRFWLGLLYWVFSNHGRSVTRPLLCYFLLTFLSFIFYLNQSLVHNSNNLKKYLEIAIKERKLPVIECVESKKIPNTMFFNRNTNLSKEAINLALRGSLLDIENISNSDSITLRCLYGVNETLNGEGKIEYIPYSPREVSYFRVIQKLFAALFVFLFGFAIRNMLRVK